MNFNSVIILLIAATMFAVTNSPDDTMLRINAHDGVSVQGGDTTWYSTVPYYEYRQLFDSSSITCIIGEMRLLTGTGRRYLWVQDFDSEAHNPLCTVPLEDLNQRQIYPVEDAEPGDTLQYYIDLLVDNVHGFDAVDLGIRDTVMFITQIYDGDSGDLITNLDTLGVFPVVSPDSLRMRMFSSFWTDTSIIRTHVLPPASGWTYSSIDIKVRCEVRGPSDNDLLCRVDTFSPEVRSKAVAEMRMSVRSILDSLTNIDHDSLLASYRDGFSQTVSLPIMDIYPNPSDGRIHLVLQNEFAGNEISFVIFDEAGGRRFTTAPYRPYGISLHVPVNVSHLPSGRYYIVPVLGTTLLPGSKFTIIHTH